MGAEGQQKFSGYAGNDFFDGGAGDRDRIDYRGGGDEEGAIQGVVVDMVSGVATDPFGDTDTFTGIERIRGTKFTGTLTGNSESNQLRGCDGDDVIDSFGGENKNLQYERGNDVINARDNDDWAEGGDGNDLITFFREGGGASPGLGSDTILGGTEGFFSIKYGGIGKAVTVDTALGQTFMTGGDVDTFTNIRNVGGGDGDATILGDDGVERQEFFSSLGNDDFDGRGGGRNWLIYDNQDEVSISIDFGTGFATCTFAETDTLQKIEAVRGTSGADRFIGGTQEYTEYQGLDGVTTFVGGSGLDRLSFTFDDNRGGIEAVNIDLQAGTANDGFGNAETFTSIEQVITTDFGDTLLGSSKKQRPDWDWWQRLAE